MIAMDKAAWQRLLSVWAAEAVERPGVKPAAGPLSGLGFPGASDGELLVVEVRLDCQLPPSYREFLKCTNGLRQPLAFVPARGGDFWSAQEVDWFRVRNQEWIDAWTGDTFVIPDDVYFVYGPTQNPINLRREYLEHTLEISAHGDSSVYVLNPRIVGVDEQWETWFFANWGPGASVYCGNHARPPRGFPKQGPRWLLQAAQP
jgi:hypothetical protein